MRGARGWREDGERMVGGDGRGREGTGGSQRGQRGERGNEK